MPYQNYLSSRHWRRVREAALIRAAHSCQLCNTQQATLDVHHRTYERRGCELPKDLIVLCRACHTKFHRDASIHTKA
jgi:5-methylcytosine-specific restriction endonuclease McrA